MLRSEVIEGAQLFERLRGEWQGLAAAAPGATPFQTWEWQSIWWSHYARGKRPRALAIREGGDLVGLATFAVCGGPWRTLRWLGGGPSDYLHPIAAAGTEEAVALEVASYLEKPAGVGLVDLHQVRETHCLAARFPAEACLTQANCLVLDLPRTYDEYLKTLGKSLRYDIKRIGKAVGDGLSVEVATTETVGEAFDHFLRLHRTRWRQRGLPGAFLGASLRFQREWVESAVRLGRLHLSTLRQNDATIGAMLAIRFGDAAYFYQSGFDPAYGSVSPGTLLISDCIRQSIEHGAVRFDFLRGDEAYKRRWKPQNSWRNLRIIRPVSVAGSAGIRWNRFAHGIEGAVRARMEGSKST